MKILAASINKTIAINLTQRKKRPKTNLSPVSQEVLLHLFGHWINFAFLECPSHSDDLWPKEEHVLGLYFRFENNHSYRHQNLRQYMFISYGR